MRKRQLIKRIMAATKRIGDEIRGNASGGGPAAGLAAEGYAGGYRDGIQSVLLLLNDAEPNDERGYWHTD